MTKEDLKQYMLSNIESARLASGGKQIICNCIFPECDDTKRHLYIGPFDSDEPAMYHCFKCNNSGIVDIGFLERFNLNNDFSRELVKVNKSKPYKIYNKSKDIMYNISIKGTTDSKLSRFKLKYINDRLGTNFTYQDCANLKIVLNLEDLLIGNKIKYLTRNKKDIEQLNVNFIGFLSRSNSSLNMRNLGIFKIDRSLDYKYINYNIFSETPKNDYYIIPTTIDLSKHVRIYIGEGPFDILGIYHNVSTNHDNSIFLAGKGKAYLQAIQFLIVRYGIYDFEVHFFPDKDVTDCFIYDIANKIKVFNCDIFIHRNVYQGEKDYGVPISKIIDNCIKF